MSCLEIEETAADEISCQLKGKQETKPKRMAATVCGLQKMCEHPLLIKLSVLHLKHLRYSGQQQMLEFPVKHLLVLQCSGQLQLRQL